MNRRIASGTRTLSITVPVEGIYSAMVNASSFNTHVYAISPFKYSPSDAGADYMQAPLVMTDLYKTYSSLYDEMKIDWVSYEICVLDVIGQGGTFSACRLWTTVDRRFVSPDATSPMTAYQVRCSSGAQGTMMTNNSRTVIKRYLAARDLQERTSWHDCTMIDGTTGNPPAIIRYDQAWNTSGPNCPFFSPALWYFMELSSAPAAQTVINLSVKVKYGVTFRNAKFGLSTSGTASTRDAGVDHRDVPAESKVVDKSVSFVNPSIEVKDACGRLACNVAGGYEGYSDGSYSIDDDVKEAVEKLGVDGFRETFGETYDEYLVGDKKDDDDDVVMAT